MIPVLYKKDEEQFNHLGLGALSEAITCVVTEERNGLFELELTYPISGSLYQEIIPERIIVADASPLLANQRFVIHRITKPKNGIIKIYAEHVSQYKTKNNSIKAKVSFNGNAQVALETWNENLLHDSGFSVYSDIGTEQTGEWTIDKVQNARRALGGVQGSMLDRYGGEYLFDNDMISLLKQRGKDSGVRIAYGKNLKDITQEIEITNTVTSIQPYSVIFVEHGTQDDILTIPEDVVHSEYVEHYAHPKILPVNFSGEEIGTVAQLRARAKRYVEENNIGIPRVNMRIDFVDLSETLEHKEFAKYEELNLCDEVLVDYEQLNILGVKAKVVKTEYNTLLDRFKSIEVGNARYSYSDSLKQAISEVEEAEATHRAWLDDMRLSIINDYFNRDSYNYDLKVGNKYDLPSGYYSFDAPIDQNPTRVIFIGGGIMAIANSKTTDGSWNWRTAATGDGFVADAVATGILNADLIRTGRLVSRNNITWLDIDNGSFSFANNRLTYSSAEGLKLNGQLTSSQLDRQAIINYGQYRVFKNNQEILNISNFVGDGTDAHILLGQYGRKLNIGKSLTEGSVNYNFITFDSTDRSIYIHENVHFHKSINGLEIIKYSGGDIGFRYPNGYKLTIGPSAVRVINSSNTIVQEWS